MNAPAVEIQALQVRFGDTQAVRELSMSAAAGQITAVLGPNGAGKSSVLGCVCTVLKPCGGTVRVFGADTTGHAVRVRRQLGVVFQEPTLDPDVSVRRNLWFHATLYGLGRAEADTRIDAVLDDCGLTERRRDRVQELSGGLARRVEIARALLHRPRLLVLDEPTTGLDPESRNRLWADLLTLRDRHGLSVLFSTHYMDEAEYADRIVFVADGRAVLDGTPLSLKATLGASYVELSTQDDDAAVAELIRAGFAAHQTTNGINVVAAEPERIAASVIAALTVPLVSVSVRHPSLDDVFLSVAAGVQ